MLTTVTDHSQFLTLASSDDEFGFTLDSHLVAEAMGISTVEMAALSVAYHDELEEGRDFVFVQHDDELEYKHFTKGGVVKLGEIIDSEQSRAFADECAGFVTSW